MQTLQTIHGVAPVRKQGTLISLALVGSLHIAVIYTLLVALEIVPNPVAPPPPPISAQVLDQTKAIPQPPPVGLDLHLRVAEHLGRLEQVHQLGQDGRLAAVQVE